MKTLSDPPYDALLLQPPPGDVTGPYPALCYLKSYAHLHGYRVLVKDLGIEALQHLSSPDSVSVMLEQAHRLRRQMEAAPRLNARRHEQYHRLSAAISVCDKPDWFARQFDLFRNSKSFFDFRQYRQARSGLDIFYGLLGALHYPTAISAAEYPSATALKTMEAILAHMDPGVNPYVRYYEDVLFPMIAERTPPLVGISMVFANQSAQALGLGRLIKIRFPEIHVVLGGAYLSQWAITSDDVHAAQLLTCADSIVCGEGEQAFIALLARISAKQTAADLPNVICLDPDAQRVLRFRELAYTDISRQPPPDYSDLKLESYLSPQTIIPYCISRGCYWGRCVFCQNRYGDYHVRRYQTVPVEKAVAEMAELSARYGSDHFNFSNDVIDPAYLKKFSQAVLDGGHHFYWNTDLRAESAFDSETCRLLAQAGLKSAAIGFESGCQKTLDAMDKGKRVEIIAEVLKNLYTAGVATQAMGIFGMPGETEADGEETVRFLEANAHHISYYVMGLLMVLPGSIMYRDPGIYGVSTISFDHNPLKTPEPVWRSGTRMSIESVNRLYEHLGRLERIYMIDEYPYVGGLSTNHSFLYYVLGTDILKRLRQNKRETMR